MAEAQSHIFNDGLRIYSTVDPEVQTALENLMLNEADENGNELFPALWHEEEVRSNIPVGSEITYDSNGLPMNPTDETASSIFSTDDCESVPGNLSHQTGCHRQDAGSGGKGDAFADGTAGNR